MLQQRFWSNLAQFSDEAILSGIEELEYRFPRGEEVSESMDADFCFDEQQLYIVGRKPM